MFVVAIYINLKNSAAFICRSLVHRIKMATSTVLGMTWHDT